MFLSISSLSQVGSSIFEAETRTHYECVKWIQSRIDRVKILEPAWLRDEILKNLNQGLSLNS
ncbi:MAG: WYL domain-containing protein, partial [Spirochaetales bacterium]|nr:WYL domain-containing protein [Spirochaetales bacterium]